MRPSELVLYSCLPCRLGRWGSKTCRLHHIAGQLCKLPGNQAAKSVQGSTQPEWFLPYKSWSPAVVFIFRHV